MALLCFNFVLKIKGLLVLIISLSKGFDLITAKPEEKCGEI